MKKLIIDSIDAKRMFASIKETIGESGNTPNRKLLGWARVEVGEDEVNVIALDGYKMCKFSFSILGINAHCEPFICYIKPIELPSYTERVELELVEEEDNKVAAVTVYSEIEDAPTLKYLFPQPQGDFIDWQNIWQIQDTTYKVSFTVSYLMKILKASGKSAVATFHFNTEKRGVPFYITSKSKLDANVDFLLLPVRDWKDDEAEGEG